MATLLAPGRRRVLATDVANDDDHPLSRVEPGQDLRPLLAELVAANQVVFAVRPDLLAWTARQDPMLQSSMAMSDPVDAWVWHNGPRRRFLV